MPSLEAQATLVALALAAGLHLPAALVAPLLLPLFPGRSTLVLSGDAGAGLLLLLLPALFLHLALQAASRVPALRSTLDAGALGIGLVWAFLLPTWADPASPLALRILGGTLLAALVAQVGLLRLGGRFLRSHGVRGPFASRWLDLPPGRAGMIALAMAAGAMLWPPLGLLGLVAVVAVALRLRGASRAGALALRILGRLGRQAFGGAPPVSWSPPGWATDGAPGAGYPALLVAPDGRIRSGWVVSAATPSPPPTPGPPPPRRFLTRTLTRIQEEALPRGRTRSGPLTGVEVLRSPSPEHRASSGIAEDPGRPGARPTSPAGGRRLLLGPGAGADSEKAFTA